MSESRHEDRGSPLRVTCVVPCHDHAPWVAGALDSLAVPLPEIRSRAGGTLFDVRRRLILVDDGSTDGSFAEVLEGMRTAGFRYSDDGSEETVEGFWKDSGLPILARRFDKARGPSFARNRGIEAFFEDTDVFFFLDSDDRYLPDKIPDSLLEWLDGPGIVGVVYSDYDTFDPNTGVRVRNHKEPFCRKRLLEECLPNSDSLISKRAFEVCGTFDEELRVCEDYDLWLRISEEFVLVHLALPLLEIRVGGHSSTARVDKGVWEACRSRVFSKALERRDRAVRTGTGGSLLR